MTSLFLLISLAMPQAAPAAKAGQWPLVAYRNVSPTDVIKAIRRSNSRPKKRSASEFPQLPPVSMLKVRGVMIRKGGPMPEHLEIITEDMVVCPTLDHYSEAVSLLEAGEIDEVAKLIEGVMERYADRRLAAPMAQFLADAYLMQGRSQDAFRLLQPYLDGSSSERLVVRASLAAALSGLRFPGQEEYVTAFHRRGDPNSPLAENLSDQARLIYISALSYCRRPEFLGKDLWGASLALQVAPRDPLASSLVAGAWIFRNVPERAAAVLNAARYSKDEALNEHLRELRVGVEWRLGKFDAALPPPRP